MATRSFSRERLREAREAAGLTQEQAARHADVTKASIQNWESGRRRPQVDELARVVTAYGVSLDWLFGGDLHANDATPAAVGAGQEGAAA